MYIPGFSPEDLNLKPKSLAFVKPNFGVVVQVRLHEVLQSHLRATGGASGFWGGSLWAQRCKNSDFVYRCELGNRFSVRVDGLEFTI